MKWKELRETLDDMKTNWSTLRRSPEGWTFEHASRTGVIIARENGDGHFRVVEQSRDAYGRAISRVRFDIDFHQARVLHLLTHGREPELEHRPAGCLDPIEMEVILFSIARVWEID